MGAPTITITGPCTPVNPGNTGAKTAYTCSVDTRDGETVQYQGPATVTYFDTPAIAGIPLSEAEQTAYRANGTSAEALAAIAKGRPAQSFVCGVAWQTTRVVPATPQPVSAERHQQIAEQAKQMGIILRIPQATPSTTAIITSRYFGQASGAAECAKYYPDVDSDTPAPMSPATIVIAGGKTFAQLIAQPQRQ